MKQHSQHSFMNLSGNIFDHRDDIMVGSQKFNRSLPYSDLRSHHPLNNMYLRDYADPMASSLKRDRLRTHTDQWSKYGDNSTLFPQSGMSHKRYMAQIQGKLMSQNSNNTKLYLNHSAALYPYSFTQYQRMKHKIQQKNIAQDKWLKTQMSRMKHQDQLIEVRDKMKKNKETPYFPLKIQHQKKVKEIFRQAREQLKNSSSKVYEEIIYEKKHQKSSKKYLDYSFLEEKSRSNKKKTATKTLSSSQVLSCDSRSKKSQRRERQKKAAIKDMISKQFPKDPPSISQNQTRQRKSLTRDRYKYVSDTSGSEIEKSSLIKLKYLNRYNQICEKEKRMKKMKTQAPNELVTDDMVDKAFVFDQLNECESDFEEDVQYQEKQLSKKKHNGYKDSLDVVYEKLYRTPEREKGANEQLLANSQKYNNKSETKQDRRYNDLLVSIERKKHLNKQVQNAKTFSNHVFYKTQKQLTNSIDQLSPETKDYNDKSKQQLSSHSKQQMQIYNRSSEQGYSVFSPYSEHKHLPNEGNDYLTASLERKKLPKHFGALDGLRKQTESKHPHLMNVKELIVDEIQKKKIMDRQLQDTGARKETRHYHVEVIGMMGKQRQEHNNGGAYPHYREGGEKRYQAQNHHTIHQTSNLNTGNHPISHHTTHHPNILNLSNHPINHHTINQPNHLTISNSSNNHHILHTSHATHQSSQTIAKNLRIELQILKQQLQDKNKKVVDMQLYLMQFKNSLIDKRQQKDNQSTTTKSRPSDSRKDMIISEDQQCQTLYEKQRKLCFSRHIVDEKILPDELIRKEKDQELFRTRSHVKRLEEKLAVQQQAMNNLFQDIGMYQKLNIQLQRKICLLENQSGRK